MSTTPHQSMQQVDKWVGRIALGITALGFLFGNNIVGRAAEMLHPLVVRLLGATSSAYPAEAVIAILNMLLAAFALLDARPRRAAELTSDSDLTIEVRQSITQLLNGWRWIWVTWILLYGWLTVLWCGFVDTAQSRSVWYVADALNAVNGFCFFYLYFVLDAPSVATVNEPTRNRRFKRSVRIALVVGIAVCVISVAADYYETGGIPTATAEGLARQLIAAYTAISMAFLVGRLDSHNLRFSRIALAPLYLYVVIQLSWGRIEAGGGPKIDTDRIVLLSLAFVLKVALFLFFSRWLKDRSLTQYLVEMDKDSTDASGAAIERQAVP